MKALTKIRKQLLDVFYSTKNKVFPSDGPDNAVFIWIPKNAGTSLFHIFARDAGFKKLKRMENVSRSFDNTGRVSFAHMSYRELRNEGIITSAYDKTAYKFCFVRNPYDRAVSLYNYLMNDERFTNAPTFLEFCRSLEAGPIEKIGLYNYKGFSQCNPQVRWLENIELDYIGHYESLPEDFRELSNVFGFSASLPQLNSSKTSNYRDYYCAESRKIVERYYKEDFDAFDYKLENFG